MEFKPHGQRTYWVEGRIFFSERRGPFNLESIRASMQGALEARKELQDSGPWAYIVICRDSLLGTPEAFAELRGHNMDPVRGRNRVATAAVIAPDVEGHGLADLLFRPMWADVGHPFEIFQTVDEARTWVGEILARQKDTAQTPREDAADTER